MYMKNNYTCSNPEQSLQLAGNCLCPKTRPYESSDKKSCITQEAYKQWQIDESKCSAS